MMALREKRKKTKAHQVEEEDDRFSKLPTDVSLDILSRLPLKTISSCRWVSKAWYHFILHPNLPQIHLARFKDSLPCAIFHSGHLGTTIMDPDCLLAFQTTATAYHFRLQDFTRNFISFDGDVCFDVADVAGIANGMICFSPTRLREYQPAPYYICNPITRDYILLPRSPKIGVRHVGSGFGFDSINNEYKVIRMVNDEVEIYTLGSRMWRQIQMNVPFPQSMPNQFHVFLNGCLHWTPRVHIDSLYQAVILSFNLTTEEFRLVPLPPVKEIPNMCRLFHLIVLDGCLCVIDGASLPYGREIWVMKEYGVHSSWVKKFVIEDKYCFRAWKGSHEVLELENNQLLLLNEEEVPSYYDYKKKTSKQIELRDLEGNPVDLELKVPIYFQGSLFSPKVIEGDQQE